MKAYERHTQGRLFDSGFLEAASKVNPIIPALIYVPVVVATLGYALVNHISTPAGAVAFFTLGWFTWQLMEYLIHRYFFHWEGIGPITRRIHEIAHGYHHHHPDDASRLVMPPGASIPMGIIVAALLYAVGRPGATMPVFAGIVSGYLFYDYVHWATHALKPRTAWGKAIRAHHMAHHFACPDRNFGISHRWVDRILGSMRRRQGEASAPSESAESGESPESLEA